MINHDRINSLELIRSRVQYLGLVLLETISKNCEKAFSKFAAERVFDEMVNIVDDPQTVVNNRRSELRYLPVYEETYKVYAFLVVMAPIFTPPRSTTVPESNASLAQQMYNEVLVISFSPEQTKEVFDVARNSIELLRTFFYCERPIVFTVLLKYVLAFSCFTCLQIHKFALRFLSVYETEQFISSLKVYFLVLFAVPCDILDDSSDVGEPSSNFGSAQ
ncbi:hypothetical protein DCAR_0206357 [Daucus carota subsp. sativus]|uniref:VHS domain-containing protein n=1 Tax=Daucus carota subsp. sativus TaxID=79200 RepID=A0AAF1AL17_DAUCS|nr:hypothetical protein DCAR_0206357 [Daucus carota subsp. sativus]